MMTYHLPTSKYKRRTAPLSTLVVHCAATTSTQDIDAADIRRWHINERGWIDGGYNAHIKRNGILQIIRPWWAEGAGVAGHNGYTWHVCLAGGVDAKGNEENNFTSQQWTTLRAVLTMMVETQQETVKKIVGHRDFPNTGKFCPSFDVPAWLKTVGLGEFA